ncbi:hypothetical protein ABV409_14965 [Flagellimonas sp. DF-77]|uniref:hypothetical protein n=1 Tax=Flagellimonas algarum TaxID=3230298 RepID=UPI00339B25E5
MNTHHSIHKTIVILLLSLLVNGAVWAQQQIAPQLLHGSWQFNEALSVNRMDPDLRERLQGSTDLQQFVQTYFSGKRITFLPNGTFVVLLSNGTQFQGQWSLQGNQLTTQTQGAGQANQMVAMGNANALCLIPEQYADPTIKQLFKEAHYIKN